MIIKVWLHIELFGLGGRLSDLQFSFFRSLLFPGKIALLIGSVPQSLDRKPVGVGAFTLSQEKHEK